MWNNLLFNDLGFFNLNQTGVGGETRGEPPPPPPTPLVYNFLVTYPNLMKFGDFS